MTGRAACITMMTRRGAPRDTASTRRGFHRREEGPTMRQHTDLIYQAQEIAAHYSLPTGQLLETLVREVTVANAGRVLELVRRVDADARRTAVAPQPDKLHGY